MVDDRTFWMIDRKLAKRGVTPGASGATGKGLRYNKEFAKEVAKLQEKRRNYAKKRNTNPFAMRSLSGRLI